MAARSFVSHNGSVYCFEASHYTYKFDLTQQRQEGVPLTEDKLLLDPNEWKNRIGYLQQLQGDTIKSKGIVWRTTLNVTPSDAFYGIHGATASPMLSMNDELFIIPGFSNWDNISKDNTDPINDKSNINLISYGKKIDKRAPIVLTNSKSTYNICLLYTSPSPRD